MIGVIYNIIHSAIISKENGIKSYAVVIYMGLYVVSSLFSIVHCVNDLCVIKVSYVSYLNWLMTIAYIDYITGYVYENMEYAGLSSVVLCVIGICGLDIKLEIMLSVIVIILVFILLHFLLGKIGCYGEGDTDVFVINLVMNTGLMCLFSDEINIFYNIIIFNILTICFVMLTFMLRYINIIDFKTLRLRERKPLVPSIYMVAVINFVYINLQFG